MNKLYINALLIAVSLPLLVSATIINIPDDYATIQLGVDASSDGDTVLVQPGTYVENINFNGHNIVLGSLFWTTGDTSYIGQTIIDGDSLGMVIYIGNGEDSTCVVAGFTIQNGAAEYGAGINCEYSNPIIYYNIICSNYALVGGGGILSRYSHPTIINNTILDNSASYRGGGICCRSCLLCGDPQISNNTISGNTADHGGGIFCDYFNNSIINNNVIRGNTAYNGGGLFCSTNNSPIIKNNVIFGNLAVTIDSLYGNGGGIYCFNSYPTIINTILWANNAENEGNVLYLDDSSPLVAYSDIQGGWEGEGNIDADPLFVVPDNGDFHLLAGSPCIDASDPDSPLDPDSTRADMGAYYYDQHVGFDVVDLLPIDFHLYQNYPNPFNASTTIKYELPRSVDVTIDIYDILGRRITAIVNKRQVAGYHQAIWRADDLPSGMYFYRIQTGEYFKTKKMLLLK